MLICGKTDIRNPLRDLRSKRITCDRKRTAGKIQTGLKKWKKTGINKEGQNKEEQKKEEQKSEKKRKQKVVQKNAACNFVWKSRMRAEPSERI